MATDPLTCKLRIDAPDARRSWVLDIRDGGTLYSLHQRYFHVERSYAGVSLPCTGCVAALDMTASVPARSEATNQSNCRRSSRRSNVCPYAQHSRSSPHCGPDVASKSALPARVRRSERCGTARSAPWRKLPDCAAHSTGQPGDGQAHPCRGHKRTGDDGALQRLESPRRARQPRPCLPTRGFSTPPRRGPPAGGHAGLYPDAGAPSQPEPFGPRAERPPSAT